MEDFRSRLAADHAIQLAIQICIDVGAHLTAELGLDTPSDYRGVFEGLRKGRFTRAAIHTEAGEVEVRLSDAGNWQLAIRGKIDREWRLACSGDLAGGAIAPPWDQREAPLRLGALTIDRSEGWIHLPQKGSLPALCGG